ncbi:MAG: RNA pseudouridine synthase [Deltaproteobacteria bacterium]|nr:RNA pseudouridine synthase [Deltaproteobacteria bacterium]
MDEVGRKGKVAMFGSVNSGGKKAITDFLVLGSDGRRSLVEVSITTGRTHQIRVHLSELGHPIVGDTLYGSPVENYNRLGRFLLHAHALTFEHPVTRNLVRVESPIPREFRL